MKVRLITSRVAKAWLPRRRRDVHKGDCGRMNNIAGSRGMAGAGILSAGGAVRAGAGLVRLATVKSQQAVAAKRAPLEVTTQGLPETKSGRLSPAAWRTIARAIKKEFRPHVVAAGPGLGQSPGVRTVVLGLLKTPVPLVLDADGLNALAGLPAVAGRASGGRAAAVFTPHEGEISHLLGWPVGRVKGDRVGAAVSAARRFGCVCLLKGAGTIVTDGRDIWKNTTGNPGLASGGTGDVLTGIIAALWGQMEFRGPSEGLKAAALGAYLHGLAGDVAMRKRGAPSLLATDVIEFLPAAMKILGGKR